MTFSQSQSTCLWKSHLFHREPLWPHEPKISAITSLSRQHLRISDAADIRVYFLTQGAFNKLYTITSSALLKDYLFRVTLPVEPSIKTASEVATLDYLRRHTKLPVPEVIAHAITSDNELGYEWMVMERLPGVCLQDIWPSYPGEKGKVIKTGTIKCSPVDWKGKEEITRVVSEYMQELRSISFKGIGSLYFRSDLERLNFKAPTIETNDSDFVIGPLVSLRLFYGGLRSRTNRNLGPYLSERDYISAWAAIQQQELALAQTLDPEDPQYDEDLVEDGPEIQRAIDALYGLIPELFVSRTDSSGYILHHGDLSLANILVDPNTFKVTGIVDWECIGTAPRCEDTYPRFLYGPEVDTEPNPWEEGDTDQARAELWESWEKVKLRRIFETTALAEEELKREFIGHLEEVVIWHRRADQWASSISSQIKP